MLRDAFYFGKKPNAHPRERYANNIDDARNQCTTDHFWIINEYCDYTKHDWDFDFELLPDNELWTEHHNNVWPSNHQKDSGTWLCSKEESKVIIYRNDVEPIKRKRTKDNWLIRIPIDETRFDFSWHPDPTDPPYIYVFGNQWYRAEIESTVEYHVANATDKKYMPDMIAYALPDMSRWTISENVTDFDFTWRPNPYSPPQIYQWEDNGPCYTMPGATEIVLMKRNIASAEKINKYTLKTTLDDLVNEHPNEIFWVINPDLNYDNFNFDWSPNKDNFKYVNVFGNEYSKNTHTYYINAPAYLLGHREFNYVEDRLIKITSNLTMFFIDKGNKESTERFNTLKTKYSRLQKTRYLNNWVDTISRCINKTETKFFWVLSSELDYTDFVFDFYPSPWQEKMIHVFGTQWSHWGNTYLINSETFLEDTKYVKVIEHLSGLNFVKSKKVKATNILYDIIYIDHGNNYQYPNDSIVVKYDETYLKTFKNILEKLPTKKEHYIWICSSVCNYDNFDFTYIVDPFAKDQLHVFPSDKQKFGDTFLVDVNKLRTLIADMSTLEDYEKVNFNQHQKAKRLIPPVVNVDDDTHVYSLNVDFTFPYMVFQTEPFNTVDDQPISLWDKKDIQITSTGGTRIVVPKEAKNYVKKELYDYPYIITNSKLLESKPMDIVFLSNGEPIADENYEHLLNITKGTANRITRVDGVNGRVAAYHAAANASNTPWLFTVFAKLRINKDFDFSWQPDRLQVPKHYIFYARNPVNNLVYGHQAMIAYNKKLVLNNIGRGLDFTLDDQHEVVEKLSGTAMFNTDPYSTWRTSFREVIKLKADKTGSNNMRLRTWLTIAIGDFAQDCLRGARDGIDYYEEVNGNIEQLRLSYEWSWLKEFYNKKYK